MVRTEIQEQIFEMISNHNDIVFIAYALLDDTEELIKFALLEILKKINKEELFTPLFSCLKELISNAIKANAKKILIDEGIIENPDNAIDVVQKIKKILNEEVILSYGIKTKERGLSSRIYLKWRKDFFVIEVVNNLPLSEKELGRIHKRIEQASKYDSIADVYLEYPDPLAEGMGLGLSMVIILLKNIDIDYHNFTLTTDGREKTYAKIKIPII